MEKDSKMKRILARLLVAVLVLQMVLPLNVMAAPSELQDTETETEVPVSEDFSESEEVSEEATEEVVSEEFSEENAEEVLKPISSEEMEDSPLDGCLYLEEVILPRNNFTVERLQSYGGFASQVTMYIPKEVTELPEAFGIEQSRLSIKEYVVEEGNPSYESIDGVLFTKPQNGECTLIGYPMYKDAESYVIPEDVTTIGDSAFWF